MRLPADSATAAPRARFFGNAGPARLLALMVLLLASLPACKDPKSGAEASSRQASAEEEAPPRIIVPYDGNLRLVTLVAELDGAAIPLDAAEVLEIPDGAAIYLETWQRLEDHRVRLVDGADRLVPFTLETGPVALRGEFRGEPEPGGTWIRLTPTASLVDGLTYSLRLEPELEDKITDHEGRPYEDFVLDLRRLDNSRPEGTDDEN